MSHTLAVTCGQLVVGGFHGVALPASFARALADGTRGGAILFKRNVTSDVLDVVALTSDIARAGRPELPLLVGVDQEGGRVARLGAPVLGLPPMATLAAIGDVDLAERAARAQAVELAALGFTTSFAPVLDVNSNPHNPVIGDRAFGVDAATVARFGDAWIRGLRSGGLLACGKHFPGHGDTSKDSHVDLPVVDAPRARLDAVELPPFASAVRAGVDALMSAHVVYPALDPERPATLSRAICTDLLREQLGFRGALISDDLEMKATSDRHGVDDAATMAIEAGCDALLVCSDEALQVRAHEALVHRAERDAAFRGRCEEAAARFIAMRRRVAPRAVVDRVALTSIVGGPASRAIADEIATPRGTS
jgi:beta-N-acetylhexosaminidase